MCASSDAGIGEQPPEAINGDLPLSTAQPTGAIYRIGGRASAAVHRAFITGPMERGTPDRRLARPRLSRACRRMSLLADALLANRPATLYGVIDPGPGA